MVRKLTMLRFEERNFPSLRRHRSILPLYRRFRLYWSNGGERTPVWKFRGKFFPHNKRRKPLRADT
jgi:hypothetical protein